MNRMLVMLTVTALLSLFARSEDAAGLPAKAPLSGVAGFLSIDDSPSLSHP